MKMLVSRKSAFIHLLTREAAPPGAQLATQLVDHRQGCVSFLLALSVFAQPASELLVQCGVLGPRAGACGCDQVFVGAQGDVLHGSLPYTTTVYTNVVLRPHLNRHHRSSLLRAGLRGCLRATTWSD